MDLNVLSPLGQLLLPVVGGLYAAWRFWVAREHRPRYRTRVEITTAESCRPVLLNAIYTVENNGKHKFDIRRVTIAARVAMVTRDDGRIVEGEVLTTASGHRAERTIEPAKERLVGISPLLPNEYAGFALRVPLLDLPACIFIVGEVELERVHDRGQPGRSRISISPCPLPRPQPERSSPVKVTRSTSLTQPRPIARSGVRQNHVATLAPNRDEPHHPSDVAFRTVRTCLDCGFELPDDIRDDGLCPRCGSGRRNVFVQAHLAIAAVASAAVGLERTRSLNSHWHEKWLRVAAAYDELARIYGKTEFIASEKFEALLAAFFGTCNDLREWVSEDNVNLPQVSKSDVLAFMKLNQCIEIANALANKDKHFSRHPGKMIAEIRTTTSGASGVRATIEHGPTGTETTVDSLDLANDCLAAWRSWLQAKGIHVP